MNPIPTPAPATSGLLCDILCRRARSDARPGTIGAAIAAGQQSEVDLIIGDRIGAQPTFAVPDCLAVDGDEQVAEAGRAIAEVLWTDLEFEREFRMMARDVYDTIPPARSLTDLPLDRWRELGVDGVVSCAVAAAGDGQLRVTARLFNTRSRESAFGVEYTGSAGNVRAYAPSAVGRDSSPSTQVERRRPHQDLLHLGPRQRVGAGPGRESPDQGGVLRRLRRGEHSPGYGQPVTEHHPELGAERPCHRLHLLAARIPRTYSYPTSTRAGSSRRRAAHATSTTGCPPGLRTAGSSRSRPTATGTPSCTSWTRTARTSGASPTIRASTPRRPGHRRDTRSRSRPTAPGRHRSTS